MFWAFHCNLLGKESLKRKKLMKTWLIKKKIQSLNKIMSQTQMKKICQIKIIGKTKGTPRFKRIIHHKGKFGSLKI